MKNPKVGQYVTVTRQYSGMLYQIIYLEPKVKTAILRFIPNYNEVPVCNYFSKYYAKYHELRNGRTLLTKRLLEKL